jgi:hypothetical protein
MFATIKKLEASVIEKRLKKYPPIAPARPIHIDHYAKSGDLKASS